MPVAERQLLEEIQQALTAFRAHSLSLSDLIERIPALVKELEPEPTWKGEFVGYWWTLENVHEEAIEAGESRRLPPERRAAVDDSVDGMLRLTRTALDAR